MVSSSCASITHRVLTLERLRFPEQRMTRDEALKGASLSPLAVETSHRHHDRRAAGAGAPRSRRGFPLRSLRTDADIYTFCAWDPGLRLDRGIALQG